jgi:hypothetical protein
MKHLCILFFLSSFLSISAIGQTKIESKSAELDLYVGTYYTRIEPVSRFIIQKEKDDLVLHIVGQGQVGMTRIGKDRFRADKVRPKTVIEFVRDSAGNVGQFKWIQPIPKLTFVRTAVAFADSLSETSTDKFSKYIGNYQLTNNRNRSVQVRLKNRQLTIQGTNEGKISIRHESGNRFVAEDGNVRLVYEFIPDAAGKITSIQYSRTGSVIFVRTPDNPSNASKVIYGFSRPNGFTRADTLRGALTALRTCYDVLFYDLDVTVIPDRKTIRGTNKIRFKAVHSFNQMQVDLFANMQIEKILYHNTSLPYRREFNAVFIQFPGNVEAGVTEEIAILYSGTPQTPEPSSLAGGIFWLRDKEGEHWIESVTQGSGASLWWPCKDHLSDKPDSMKISVTVPHGLTDISNGRLIHKTELPDSLTRFEWYVSYPITTYCVVINIGNYKRFKDLYISSSDTLHVNYYCMNYDVAIAKKIFNQARPMLSVFENCFGKYPFWRDGFTVMESIYPMEHQGAVSFGSIFSPFNSDRYDSLDLVRTMWHETAHEWWGNSITVQDMADLWIHEAFATYGEVLAYEQLKGSTAARGYLREQHPANKEAIIGRYGVNDFRLGDVYSKGVLIIHTLRNTIANDSVWFGLLRSIQLDFAYQTITTQDLVQYISDKTKTDYHYFFEQYLTKASPPELQLLISRQGAVTTVKYRWHVDVAKFNMPAKIIVKGIYTLIHPTTEWAELKLENIKPKDIKVDHESFYIQSKTRLGQR